MHPTPPTFYIEYFFKYCLVHVQIKSIYYFSQQFYILSKLLLLIRGEYLSLQIATEIKLVCTQNNRDYENFNQEKIEEEIAVGVPITLAPGQVPTPYLNQQQNQTNFMNVQPQGYYPNQEVSMNAMINQPRMPPVIGVNPQIIPAQQTQFSDFSKPINIRCPCCSAQVNTVVNFESGNATYFWAGVIFCCISPLCTCLPFVTDKCMDKNHYCPNCGFNILRKHRGFFDCS